VGEIGAGLLAFIGVTPADTDENAEKLVSRMLKYRIFADEAGKMNLNLQQIAGGLLLVPQFTLAADTRHGLRPGFSTAAPLSKGAPVRCGSAGGACAAHASRHWTVRRRHAGFAGQRRTGDVLARELTASAQLGPNAQRGSPVQRDN